MNSADEMSICDKEGELPIPIDVQVHMDKICS